MRTGLSILLEPVVPQASIHYTCYTGYAYIIGMVGIVDLLLDGGDTVDSCSFWAYA